MVFYQRHCAFKNMLYVNHPLLHSCGLWVSWKNKQALQALSNDCLQETVERIMNCMELSEFTYDTWEGLMLVFKEQKRQEKRRLISI
jgi:hypothetical protein